MENDKNFSDVELKDLYRLYEFDPDVEFPDMVFPCGSLKNYVRMGILTGEEEESLWNQNG